MADRIWLFFFLYEITQLVAKSNSVDVKCLIEIWVYDVVQHSMLIKRLKCKVNKERKVELFGALEAEGKNSILEQVLSFMIQQMCENSEEQYYGMPFKIWPLKEWVRNLAFTDTTKKLELIYLQLWNEDRMCPSAH